MSRACTKVPYRSENEALVRLISLWKRVRSARRKFTERHAYKCRRCGRWHLTSQ